MKLIDFNIGEDVKPADYSLKTEYSIFEYPFPLEQEGVITYQGKICGYFTNTTMVIFSAIYVPEFWEEIIRGFLSGLEKRVLVVQTADWGYNRFLSFIFAIIFRKYKKEDLLFINEILDFMEKGEVGGIEKDEELEELMRIHYLGLNWTEENMQFVKKLLALIRPLIDKEIKKIKKGE